MKRRLAAGIIGVCCLGGCVTSPTQLGQTAGGILGSLLVPGVGTGLGTLVGTVAGLVVENELDKVRQQKERAELSDRLQDRPMTAAEVLQRDGVVGQPARVWVDETVSNGSVMAGRFEERVIP